MGYKDLMKPADSLSNAQALIEAKCFEVVSSQNKAYLELRDMDFDKDRGFVLRGEVGVGVRDYHYTGKHGSCNGIYVCTAPDENNQFHTWVTITIKKGVKAKVGEHIYSLSGPICEIGPNAWKSQNSVNLQPLYKESQSSVENGCHQDLQPLFEDYFWDFLRAAYNNASSDGQIVQQIEELALGEAVSSYLRGLIAAYNDSFLRNRGALEERGALLGYSSSQQRYGICASDENFQRVVDAQKRFLNMRFDNNLGFFHKNFVGDEAKYFLYRMDSLQKDFLPVLKEFGWRLAPIKTYYVTQSKGNVTKRLVKGFEKLYKTLTDDFFTKEEKARIRTLEKAIFTGDKTARAAYDSLVGELKGRYLSEIDEVERLYNAFYSCKLDDGAMTQYAAYRTEPGTMIWDWIQSARKNFERLGYELKDAPADKKRREFERQTGRLLSVSTYVGKDGRERKMTLLDRCGQIILEKAESIEEIKDAAFKKKEYELLIKDVEALREIQYLIGVYGKNKAALLDDGDAAYPAGDSSGSGSFGEVSDFLSTDAYLDKLYAKINGESTRTGSFGNTGHSDAGGGAWHDGTVGNQGESRFSFQKILKIGLAVIIALFLLRACGGIF